MNDVREAIERVGASFDPSGGGIDELSRRRARARTRRRVMAGVLALSVTAGGSLLAVRAFPASSPRSHTKMKVVATWAAPGAAPSSAATAGAVQCPTPSGDSPPPVVLSTTSGAAGSSVEVSGMFGSEELWMQLLWNAGQIGGKIAPPPWPPTGPELPFDPAGPGSVVKLAAIAGPPTTGECLFHTRFTVPDVEAGTYRLRWFFGALAHANYPPHPKRGYALWSSELTFHVTG
jgi:hypothetical protein